MKYHAVYSELFAIQSYERTAMSDDESTQLEEHNGEETPEQQPPALEETSPDAFSALYGQLKRWLPRKPRLHTWVTEWAPVVVAFSSLLGTAQKFAMQLKSQLKGDDKTAFQLPEEMFQELSAEFQELGKSFPNVTELIFGVDDIDVFIQEFLANEENRAYLTGALDRITSFSEPYVQKLIEGAYFASKSNEFVTTDALVSYFSRAEAILQKLCERWLIPQSFKHDDSDSNS